MHIILTHEQADFDAVAAMLGASLIQGNATPVLPRRLNRNVKAFLTLYGSELPFIELGDLPNQPIETITLVDTQSLITLRGMSKKTAINVVDHHALRANLPAEWNISHDSTGACTTLFIESFRDQHHTLHSIQATLLLMGIYEDTGSMLYAGTTARDVRAAAYLLAQGANLQIAARFLNPGLSAEQRAVFDRLLAASTDLVINGQSITIAAVEALEMTEEISSIAHKIRDLIDPSALFLIAHTVDGLRLVARSTTDQVDVSGIAAHFGGGGHERASAALVKIPANGLLPYQQPGETLLEAMQRELVHILPQHIRPPVTVRQIMSRHPLTIDPDMPLEKALKLMQRYGYEGYPVVKDGVILGLLNRRSVDRASSHKLQIKASSLMEAGNIFVTPEDSIDHLREVMTTSGWGQVPVLDENGNLIGIATRTDLLKHLPGKQTKAGRKNLAEKLDSALPPARLNLLKAVAAEARRLHYAIYIVGGFVRDLLLERPGVDFDLVVEGDAIAVANALAKRFGGRVLAHSRFGTAKWSLNASASDVAKKLGVAASDDERALPDSLDLISARTEFYDFPTALPTVERSGIKLDLHRRDFTINTMAIRLDGQYYGDLYDYWGGLRDLQSGLVRVLHSLSFVDDPTRQLRAVRFEQRFGFQIESRTLQLMNEGRDLIHNLSGDRLRHELNLILQERAAITMLDRLAELGLLDAIHPDLPWDNDIAELIQKAREDPVADFWEIPMESGSLPRATSLAYILWFANLSLETAFSIANRIRLPGNLQTNILMTLQLLHDFASLPDESPSGVVMRLDGFPTMALYAAWLLIPTQAVRDVLVNYASIYRNIHPVTN
ncbi:MAG: CBS domain-containing protein, partial [Anaerolineae bacterium]|nr:CBS domain-containing protein [Anaerolineae bacterium]